MPSRCNRLQIPASKKTVELVVYCLSLNTGITNPKTVTNIYIELMVQNDGGCVVCGNFGDSVRTASLNKMLYHPLTEYPGL